MYSFFPKPLPDETVYSLLCRFHLASAQASFKGNTLKLFKINGSRPNNEFPSFLNEFEGLSGIDMPTLINQMTSFHYYEPFLSPDMCLRLYDSLRTGKTESLQSQLGIVASRFTYGKELKSCPLCMKENIDTYGTTYWHLEHQITGVLSCPKHKCILKSEVCSPIKLLLPKLNKNLNVEVFDGEEYRFSSLLASELHDLNCDIHLPELYNAYWDRLRELSLLTQCGRVRQATLHKLVQKCLERLSDKTQHFRTLYHQVEKDYFPQCLLYQRSVQHHPLQHFAFIFSLFDSWEHLKTFIASEHTCDALPNNQSVKVELDWSSFINQLIKGESLRKVAASAGVSIATLKARAIQYQVPIATRPSKVFDKERRIIWRKLLIGKPTEDIATDLGISQGAVEQVLKCYPEIKELRARIRYKAKRDEMLAILEKCIRDNPSFTRNQIKQAENAAYMWLFKHEKSLLNDMLPKAILRQK